MKYSDLEDQEKLATKDWVEHQFASFKTDLKLARLDRTQKLFNWAGLVAFGFSPSFAVSIEKRENERFLPLNSRHLRGEKTVGGVWDNLPTFRRVLA